MTLAEFREATKDEPDDAQVLVQTFDYQGFRTYEPVISILTDRKENSVVIV